MGENQGDHPKAPGPEPGDLSWAQLSEKMTAIDQANQGRVDSGEPKSNPWENFKPKESKRGDSFSGCVYAQFLQIVIYVIVVVFGAMATNATMRMIVIGGGLITGAYFGVAWLRKAVIKQEAGLFSRESGFTWLLLSLGCALTMFFIDLVVKSGSIP